MTITFTLDNRAVPDGTVLLFGIRYEPEIEPGDTVELERRQNPTTYTYVMLKAGGFWYVTGGGRTPQVAGWGAVERWLERDGRIVEWVRHVTETTQLWPRVDDLANAKAAEEKYRTSAVRKPWPGKTLAD